MCYSQGVRGLKNTTLHTDIHEHIDKDMRSVCVREREAK